MRTELGIEGLEFGKARIEDLLTVGSRIFFQTHFFPLIKMQGFAREIYLTFNSADKTHIPVLLNVMTHDEGTVQEIHCGGMIISNRNRFEKELLLAKNTAEEALSQNSELIKVRDELEMQQRELERQLRNLSALNRQQQDIFKVISHDLQEPLRKSVMFANYIKSESQGLPNSMLEKLDRIIAFNETMRQMILSLQRIEELEYKKIDCKIVELQPLIESAKLSLGNHCAKVKIDYQLSCQTVYADSTLLKNMFSELFNNSMRFSNLENNFLTIKISSMIVQKNIFEQSEHKYLYEDFVKITFSDDGIGFIRDASKVFTIFQRGEQFDKISPGLAYCRRIVELHYGTIIAKSIRGKGAGFTIFIPVNRNQ